MRSWNLRDGRNPTIKPMARQHATCCDAQMAELPLGINGSLAAEVGASHRMRGS